MTRYRIGIDGYNLALPNGTGIATYGRMLTETLRGAGYHVDGVFGLDVSGPIDQRETLFYDRLARPQRYRRKWGRLATRGRLALGMARGTALDAVPQGRVDARAMADRLPRFDQIWSSKDLFDRSNDYFRLTGKFATISMAAPPAIMHWTYPVPVTLMGARNIYTIHDLVPFRLPFATLDDKRWFHRLIETCAREADHICTVSRSSRDDIIELLGVDPARVSNTYQISSMPPELLAEDRAESARKIEGMFGLKADGYFLFYGAIEPKKNVGRLIEAYLSLDTATPLIIVAGRSWQSAAELVLLPRADDVASPRHAHLERRIIQIDYLPRHMLMRLLRGARALAFPSLSEGFGLPVLEAMLLGVPVLASNTASLPEVAGDAAILVDPYDSAAIAMGLRRLDRDAELRGNLSRLGPAQAAQFSVDRYQAALTTMYDQVMGAAT